MGLKEKHDELRYEELPRLTEELIKINPLYEKNKGWLTPIKVGINETNETKKLIKKIYKRIKAKFIKKNEGWKRIGIGSITLL